MFIGVSTQRNHIRVNTTHTHTHEREREREAGVKYWGERRKVKRRNKLIKEDDMLAIYDIFYHVFQGNTDHCVRILACCIHPLIGEQAL